MKQEILSYLKAECPWGDTLLWLPSTDSTNLRAKELARQGAPHGTVVLAGKQTAGRGRLGRSFDSRDGGVYLSLILRPACPPEQLMHLTCAVGVAMSDAVEAVAGFRPGLKWINDLVHGTKKLGGILTEMAIDPATGLVDYGVVGIGINCCQKDFPEELRDMAASLSTVASRDISPAPLAAAMVYALWQMDKRLLSEKEALMDAYRSRCVTLGKDIQVLKGGQVLPGKALDVDGSGALLVRYPDGRQEYVSSGEVSVRGMYGYM